MRVQQKIRTGGSLHAFTISNSRTQSSVALKSVHNRCDWNNGTPGETVEGDVTFVVCELVIGCLCVCEVSDTCSHAHVFVHLCDVFVFCSSVICLSPCAQSVELCSGTLA